MWYRKLISVVTIVLLASGLYAQTPVETLIEKYKGTDGAKNVLVQGVRMTLARRFLENTPVAPIASDVEELAILKMGAVPQNVRLRFVSDLKTALKTYKYYGTHPSKNGEVEVYILPSGLETVKELVIYNPALYNLNSFYGDFSVDDLLRLEK